MLRFISAQAISNEAVTLTRPADTSHPGVVLGDLTMMVINRFIEQIAWDDVVSIYLAGLVDEEDEALIQRAVKALMEGGVEFV